MVHSIQRHFTSNTSFKWNALLPTETSNVILQRTYLVAWFSAIIPQLNNVHLRKFLCCLRFYKKINTNSIFILKLYTNLLRKLECMISPNTACTDIDLLSENLARTRCYLGEDVTVERPQYFMYV